MLEAALDPKEAVKTRLTIDLHACRVNAREEDVVFGLEYLDVTWSTPRTRPELHCIVPLFTHKQELD